jgi:hypothetical protein
VVAACLHLNNHLRTIVVPVMSMHDNPRRSQNMNAPQENGGVNRNGNAIAIGLIQRFNAQPKTRRFFEVFGFVLVMVVIGVSNNLIDAVISFAAAATIFGIGTAYTNPQAKREVVTMLGLAFLVACWTGIYFTLLWVGIPGRIIEGCTLLVVAALWMRLDKGNPLQQLRNLSKRNIAIVIFFGFPGFYMLSTAGTVGRLVGLVLVVGLIIWNCSDRRTPQPPQARQQLH